MPSGVIRDDWSLESIRRRSALGHGELGGRSATLRGRHGTFRFPKVNPAEISEEFLESLGFRRAGAHRLHAGKARAN